MPCERGGVVYRTVCSQTCVPCRAVPGREGVGKVTLHKVATELGHIGELVISDGGADLAGDGQEQRDLLRAEAVGAAVLEQEAEAGASAQRIPLVADAAVAYVTHPAGTYG